MPFLVNPTQCTSEPLDGELPLNRGRAKPGSRKRAVGPFTGCESLPFAPTIAVAPEQTQATTPTGYAVDLNVPQTEGAEGLAHRRPGGRGREDARRRRALPVGGERARGVHRSRDRPRQRTARWSAPTRSKLGEVSLVTPALTGELKGALYLGGPPSGPITSPPFEVYLTLAGHGVLVKIKGTVDAGPGDRSADDDVR